MAAWGDGPAGCAPQTGCLPTYIKPLGSFAAARREPPATCSSEPLPALTPLYHSTVARLPAASGLRLLQPLPQRTPSLGSSIRPHVKETLTFSLSLPRPRAAAASSVIVVAVGRRALILLLVPCAAAA